MAHGCGASVTSDENDLLTNYELGTTNCKLSYCSGPSSTGSATPLGM